MIMKIAALFACLLVTFGSMLNAQDADKERAFLAESVGEWNVSIGTPGSEMTGTCTYKTAHNGMWLESKLDMKMPDGPFTGQGFDSYDPAKKKFVGIWVDSMSAAPLILEGTRSTDGKKVTMTGKGTAPDGAQVDCKTETEFVSKEKHVFKMWMGSTTGEPMMVATYTRKK
jgi:hypothetical protein